MAKNKEVGASKPAPKVELEQVNGEDIVKLTYKDGTVVKKTL